MTDFLRNCLRIEVRDNIIAANHRPFTHIQNFIMLNILQRWIVGLIEYSLNNRDPQKKLIITKVRHDYLKICYQIGSFWFQIRKF